MLHFHTHEDDDQELLQILGCDGRPIEDIPTYTSCLYIVPLIYLTRG